MGVKSTFYNQASVLRTIKGIFGASGLTRTEVLSTPLVAYFGAKVDTHFISSYPGTDCDATNPKSAKRTSFDLTKPDRVPEDRFDRDQWAVMRPTSGIQWSLLGHMAVG
jgi:hypothetical protein